MKNQHDGNYTQVDYKITRYRDAKLMPPPYRQVIPFRRDHSCDSLVIHDPKDCDYDFDCSCDCEKDIYEDE